MLKKLTLLIIIFLSFSINGQETIWDQGVPICPDDQQITNLINKIGNRDLSGLDSISDKSKLKLFREVGFAFYDRGEYDAADWYFKRAKNYKEQVDIEEPKPKLSDSDLSSMKSDLKMLNSLPSSYTTMSKNDMLKMAKIIDEQIKKLTYERDSILKSKNPNQEILDTKENAINSLNKEKEVINLTLETDSLKVETKDLKVETKDLKIQKEELKKYLWWASIAISVLILILVVLWQRKRIKVQDVEIDVQAKDINKKNTYLEHAARIIRHDMHSGINTYIPRGIASLEKKLSEEEIKNLKIESPLKMIKEGLKHTQGVYKSVYEFTNLVKQNSILDKKNVDLKDLLDKYLINTSYKQQVVISNLIELEVNEVLFCNAVDNLIKNGLKYNDSIDKKVVIYMENNNLIIEDNGRGLTQKDFEKFSKPNKSEEGIGLNICLAILEEHGFSLSCEKITNGTKMKIKLN